MSIADQARKRPLHGYGISLKKTTFGDYRRKTLNTQPINTYQSACHTPPWKNMMTGASENNDFENLLNDET